MMRMKRHLNSGLGGLEQDEGSNCGSPREVWHDFTHQTRHGSLRLSSAEAENRGQNNSQDQRDVNGVPGY